MGKKAQVSSHAVKEVKRSEESLEQRRLTTQLLTGTLGSRVSFQADAGESRRATQHELNMGSGYRGGERRKTTLLDAARSYLEDHGDAEHLVEEMGLEEQQFIKMCADVHERVINTKAIFDDVDSKVRRRVQDLSAKREAKKLDDEEEEHFSYTQYLEWKKENGRADDEPSEIADGNLLPILAVLEGECDALHPLRTKNLRRVGDFFVDESELIGEENFDEEDFPTLLTRTRAVQTETFNADQYQQIISDMQADLTATKRQLASTEGRIAQLELFRESAMRRLVSLRENVIKLHDQHETEHRKMLLMLAESMGQNERLVNRMESWAGNDKASAQRKEKIQKGFTKQIMTLRSRNGVLKSKMQRLECQLMGMEDDYHFQAAAFQRTLQHTKAGQLEKPVWDQLDKLNYTILDHGTGVSGGQLFDQAKFNEEESLHLELSPYFVAATESVFKNADFNCFSLLRNAAKLIGAKDTKAIVEIVKDMQEFVPNMRETIFNCLSDLTVATSDFEVKMKERFERSKQLIVERHEKELEDKNVQMEKAVERARENQYRLMKDRHKPKVTTTVGVNTDSAESLAEFPPPRMATMDLPPDVSVEHPQDALTFIHGYLVDVATETSMFAHSFNQKPPARIEGLYNIFYLLKLLIPKVTTGCGLVEGMGVTEGDMEVSDPSRDVNFWWCTFESEASKSVSMLRNIKDADWKRGGYDNAFAAVGGSFASLELAKYKKLLSLMNDKEAASDILAKMATHRAKGKKDAVKATKKKPLKSPATKSLNVDDGCSDADAFSTIGSPTVDPLQALLEEQEAQNPQPKKKVSKKKKSGKTPLARPLDAPVIVTTDGSSPNNTFTLDGSIGSSASGLLSPTTGGAPAIIHEAASSSSGSSAANLMNIITPPVTSLPTDQLSPWQGDSALAAPTDTTPRKRKKSPRKGGGTPRKSPKKSRAKVEKASAADTPTSAGSSRSSSSLPRSPSIGEAVNNAATPPAKIPTPRTIVETKTVEVEVIVDNRPEQYDQLRQRLNVLRKQIETLCKVELPAFERSGAHQEVTPKPIPRVAESFTTDIGTDSQLVDQLADAITDEYRRQVVAARKRPTAVDLESSLPSINTMKHSSRASFQGSPSNLMRKMTATNFATSPTARAGLPRPTTDKGVTCDLLKPNPDEQPLSTDGLALAIAHDMRAFSSQAKERREAAKRRAEEIERARIQQRQEQLGTTLPAFTTRPVFDESVDVEYGDQSPPGTASTPLIAMRRLSPSRNEKWSLRPGAATPTLAKRPADRKRFPLKDYARTPEPKPTSSLVKGKTIREIYY